MDSGAYNAEAWDRQVKDSNRWTVPVSPEEIAAARGGEWSLVLTPRTPIPTEWYDGPVAGRDILCLASGGGQQGPILAAAGANVTVFDASGAQLEQDRLVAAREGLALRTVQGDMRDLSMFDDASFDLIVHPVSNCFVEEIMPVWREAYRVLRSGGALLSGFNNPIVYCMNWGRYEHDREIVFRHKLPYSDLTSLTPEELQRRIDSGEPLEFSHTLESQIGGQLAAGFLLQNMFEDEWDGGELIDDYFPSFIATRARKL